MAAIRGANTKPELLIRKALHERGYRYRLNVKTLSGKPDMVFRKYRAVILVHGCFWHGHQCHLFKWPGTREEFWREKISGNRERDRSVYKGLREQNWRIATVWECALKGKNRRPLVEIIDSLADWLSTGSNEFNVEGLSIEGAN